jgi:hypothetical protein
VKGCVCDVAGSSKVTRRRRQQPKPHCWLAARRVANAGQDIVDAPPGVKGCDVEASCWPSSGRWEPAAANGVS